MADTGSTFLDLVTEQIGIPYVYGGDSPSGGFDCSGLVQWAAGKVGVTLPRGATDQLHAIPHTSAPVAGDLVFFNTGDGWEAGHVGICADTGCSEMIDAPHTGALVRRESVQGFGTIVGYGVLPGNRGHVAEPGTSTNAGGSGLLGTGVDLGGLDPTGLLSGITDPLTAAIDAVGALPGELLKVFLGGHTLPELVLRTVEIVGGALVFAAGVVTVLVVVADRGSAPARAAQTTRRTARKAAAPVRRGIAATEPERAPRTRTTADRRRLDALLRAERGSGRLAGQADRLRP